MFSIRNLVFAKMNLEPAVLQKFVLDWARCFRLCEVYRFRIWKVWNCQSNTPLIGEFYLRSVMTSGSYCTSRLSLDLEFLKLTLPWRRYRLCVDYQQQQVLCKMFFANEFSFSPSCQLLSCHVLQQRYQRHLAHLSDKRKKKQSFTCSLHLHAALSSEEQAFIL